VEPQADAGIRELYVDYLYEVSNPLKFDVSDYPELTEPATNNVSGSLVDLPDLPVCLNGRIFGDKPDGYRFKAESGQKIVAFFKSEVMPLGGFIPELKFADSDGLPITNGVAAYFEGSAPVLVYDVGKSGDYTLQISDSAGEGGRSSIYRVVLGALPLITDFSPKCVTKGKSANVKLTGVNLSESRVRLFSGGKDAAMCMQTIAGSAFVLPGLSFDLVEESVVIEEDLNNTAEKALHLSLPVIVEGTFKAQTESPDFYSYDGVSGEELYIDIESGVGQPHVKVRDPAGAVVASGAYQELSAIDRLLKGGNLSLPFKCTASGRYTIEVSLSKNAKGGAVGYQMRVGTPAPDYEVWMTPAAINIPRYGSKMVDLYVHRIHGYDREINVSAAFPALGIASAGGYIAPDSERGLVTVWTDGPRHPRVPFYQSLVAESEFNGVIQKKSVKPVVFAKTGRTELARTFEKPPARVAYYEPAMVINMTGEPPLVLSVGKEREVVLSMKSVKGDLFDDYDYVVIAPEKGVVINEKIPSKARDLLRLNIALAPGTPFRAGDKADLIIGMLKKGDDGSSVVAASQAVRFTCQ